MNAGDDRERSSDMSVAMCETELLDTRDPLLGFWEDIEVPPGWRAEIMEGTVVVSPAPAVMHNRVANALSRLMHRSEIPETWEIYQTASLQIGTTGDIYVPDLVVYPADRLPGKGGVIQAEHALLVVEITSPSNADHDRERKLWGYAHGPVPLYLLVDPHAQQGPQVTLYSCPGAGTYRSMDRVPYGGSIVLPDPFNLTVDTTKFPTD
jgi:Uma2 family endonuclease